MGIDTTEQRETEETPVTAKQVQEQQPDRAVTPQLRGRAADWLAQLRSGLRQLQWVQVLLFGGLAGVLMTFSFFQGTLLSIVAGIVPVGTGLLVARRVKGNYALHGLATGLVGALVVMVGLGALLFLAPPGVIAFQSLGVAPGAALRDIWLTGGGFLAFSLITFCTFGATMAGRSEERNRLLREQVRERGGQLERAGAVRGADDIRGLSLPQLGWYVNNLFKKKGFHVKDYRFIDKDKHLDLWLEYEGELWHLRLSVADKVGPGTIESLSQDMKREGCRKGVVVASTEFLPSAVKAAKGRPLVLIDGQMLFQIAET